MRRVRCSPIWPPRSTMARTASTAAGGSSSRSRSHRLYPPLLGSQAAHSAIGWGDEFRGCP